MTKIAAIQLKPDLSSSDGTISEALRFIEEAANLGVEVACFPEHWLTNSVVTLNKLITQLSHSAQKYKMYIISGANFEKIDGEIFVSSQVIDPSGEIVARQTKVHLFKEEKKLASPGRHYCVFNIKDFKAGIMICYDAVFPEVARILALKGADIIFVPSRIRKEGIEPWHLYLKARSLENRVAVVGVNMALTPRYTGRSTILMPEIIKDSEGSVVYPKVLNKGDEMPQVVMADLDINSIKDIRTERLKDRKPETYKSIAEF